MFAQLTKKNLKCLVPAVILAALVGAFVADSGHGISAEIDSGVSVLVFRRPILIGSNILANIDPVAIVADNGRHLLITGPIGCTIERADVQVTITQRSTGAVAYGHTFITCNGNIQQWVVDATPR